MTNVVRNAGTPLTEERRRGLQRLSALLDSEVDLSDIPETTQKQFGDARQRPRPLATTRASGFNKAS